MLYQSLSKAVNSVLAGFDVHLQAELAGGAGSHGPDAGNEAAGEGALAVFKTGFFGAFTRTYYPASVIAAINQVDPIIRTAVRLK